MTLRIALQTLIALVAYAILLLQFPGFADDPGVGWHLRAGELMLEGGAVPRNDPFLALEVGDNSPKPWIHDQWLTDLLGGALYQAGGFPLLYAVSVGLYLTAFLVICQSAFSRIPGLSPLALLCATLLAFKLGQVHFILRPVLLGIFCAACLSVLLFGGSGRSPADLLSWRRISLLWLLFLAWTNLHPSFALGLVLFGVFTAFELGSALLKQQPIPWRLLVVLVGAGMVTLMNPYGIALHRSILELSGSDYFMNLHSEWGPPRLSSLEGYLLIGTVSVTVLGLIRGARPPLSAVALFLLLALMSMRAVRILPFFAIFAVLPLATALTVLARERCFLKLPALALTRRTFARIDTALRVPMPSIPLIGVVATLLWSVIADKVPLYSEHYGPSPERYPYSMVKTLLTQHPRDLVILASPAYGGFLAWQGKGQIRPVLDDRNLTVGESLYREFFAIAAQDSNWHSRLLALFERYQVDLLLVSAGSDFQRSLLESDDFVPYLSDERFVLFSRATSKSTL